MTNSHVFVFFLLDKKRQAQAEPINSDVIPKFCTTDVAQNMTITWEIPGPQSSLDGIFDKNDGEPCILYITENFRACECKIIPLHIKHMINILTTICQVALNDMVVKWGEGYRIAPWRKCICFAILSTFSLSGAIVYESHNNHI